jgi:hypothetical protein
LIVHSLLYQVIQEATEQLQQAGQLPHDAYFDFDPAREDPVRNSLSQKPEFRESECKSSERAQLPSGRVVKTKRRAVVTLKHGCFQARETVRAKITSNGQRVMQRSAVLANLVPQGSCHAFDLIAYIGLETYLHGRSLEDVQQALVERQPSIAMPLSTLWDQQQRFLFSLGRVHECAAPLLREYLAGRGQTTWLLDGTLEPETPVFLGVQDATSAILLGCWKIPSENADDMAVCLTDATNRFGFPAEVLHDLSTAMIQACETALSGIAHRVCHFHLARDVGNDLCAALQVALTKRHRSLKILSRLREQRKGQTEWLRDQFDQPAVELVLNRLLAGESLDSPTLRETLGHEVLLGFHYWILDYRNDGRRRGFPFDPYTLYLHRRLERAGEAVDRLLSIELVARQAPVVLHNFRRLLAEYRRDEDIKRTADGFERAFAMFGRLREALHLTAEDMCNLRQPYDLTDSDREPLSTALHILRESLRLQAASKDDKDWDLAETVLTHLDKYWSYLVPEQGVGSSWPRTTNQLESAWSTGKRHRRQCHGRSKLTRDFQSLPAEYMLVPNLSNPQYIDLVLEGSLDNLASKMAAACAQGPSFARWRANPRYDLLGQIRRRHLRSPSFLADLVDVSTDHCTPDDTTEAA